MCVVSSRNITIYQSTSNSSIRPLISPRTMDHARSHAFLIHSMDIKSNHFHFILSIEYIECVNWFLYTFAVDRTAQYREIVVVGVEAP